SAHSVASRAAWRPAWSAWARTGSGASWSWSSAWPPTCGARLAVAHARRRGARVQARRGVSRTARRFVERVEAERARPAAAVEGTADAAERERYAGLLLHRLMLLYFLQAKGLLAADPDYMRNALLRVQARRAAAERASYYREFLLPVFHGEMAGGA